MDKNIISLIRHQLQLPLPGRAAQYKMATSTRMPYKEVEAPDDVRLASVLCLLYPHNSEWHIPLIQRVVAVNDRHSGQIGFPGGKLEETDHTYADGALREANEEIGVPREDIEILGAMTPLYIPVSNFQVFPFIGYISYRPDFVPQVSEVADIIEVSLDDLVAPDTLKYKSMTFKNHLKIKDVPHFDVSGKTVWGATGMMLSEFVEIVNQVKSSTI